MIIQVLPFYMCNPSRKARHRWEGHQSLARERRGQGGEKP